MRPIPVNAFEAEGRRVSRFFTENHTPAPVEVRLSQEERTGIYRYVTAKKTDLLPLIPKEVERSGDYFVTLDLQQVD